MAKIRVEGDFFDIRMSPFINEATYNFSFGDGLRMSVPKFRDALRLLNMLSLLGGKLLCEMEFDGYPLLGFSLSCKAGVFGYEKELAALEAAAELLGKYGLDSDSDISFDEVIKYSDVIIQVGMLLGFQRPVLKIEFNVDEEGFDLSRPAACIFTVSAPIGSHVVGALLVMTGELMVSANGKYALVTNEFRVEKKLVSVRGRDIDRDELNSVMDGVAEKYQEGYSVVRVSDLNEIID